jgi:hypothetical protein
MFSFKGQHFQVASQRGALPIPPKSRVEVLASPALGYGSSTKMPSMKLFPAFKQKEERPPSPVKRKELYHPPGDHCYKYGHNLWPKLSFAESDAEILQMLEETFLKKYA